MNDLEAQNKALRQHIKVLTAHIHSGINCGFFCALPECAKYLSGETHDTNPTHPPRSEAVECSSCPSGSEPF